jgi:tRNA U34 2-thiouridine synthase MnmA/TrmU
LKKVPGKFIREGGISTLDPNEVIAEHEGVQGFTPGQEFEYRDNGKQMKGIIASYSFPERRITVVENEHLIREKFLLTKCHFSEEVSWLEPVKGYAVLGQEDAIECWIYPKPLSAAFIELAEPHKVINGQVVSIIKKKGKNSKIYLTGEIQMLPIEPGPEEEEASEPKVNHVIDF